MWGRTMQNVATRRQGYLWAIWDGDYQPWVRKWEARVKRLSVKNFLRPGAGGSCL
jgi:hypothetical protein